MSQSQLLKQNEDFFAQEEFFVLKPENVLILAFNTYIMPMLEYCSPAWNPQNVTDEKSLESVQRMFPKRLPGYEGLKYPDRFQKVEMCTLELRRIHADLYLQYIAP